MIETLKPSVKSRDVDIPNLHQSIFGNIGEFPSVPQYQRLYQVTVLAPCVDIISK